jgi:hypothetical protein
VTVDGVMSKLTLMETGEFAAALDATSIVAL